ncbi:MAG: hypothetical protein ACYC0H_14070 [Solirubrobacteraceae bacterium]
MSKITVPRADLTTDEVVQALHRGLGQKYNVLPGMRLTLAPFAKPVPGTPDTIVVGIASNRARRAQVSIVRRSGVCELQISPGGLTSDRLLNMVVTTPKVRRVLADAPQLREA